MTDSASTFISIIFGLGVFLVIVAVGWRSVQNRRILRVQGADGHETIIVAGEDDDISSVVTTTTETTSPVPAPEFGRRTATSKTAVDIDADVAARDRLDRVVSSTE